MIRKDYPVTNVYLFKNKLWLDEFSTRMHEWLKGNKRPPIKIDAELHRRCNLKCKFCSRRESDKDLTEESKKIEVSKKRWLEIAEESGKMGVKGWNISGIGEPMCKPDLTLSVMEKLKEYDIFGELTTNGTLWNDKMIRKTVEMGWDSVCVSLDSPDKKTHNELRQGNAFDRAVRTVELFEYYKKEMDRKRPSVTLNVVLNKKNYKQMPELFYLGKDLGIDAIFIEPMITYTVGGEKLKLNEGQIEEFKKIAEECKKIGNKYGIEPNINCFTEDEEYDKELVGKTSKMKDVLEEEQKNGGENYKNPSKEYDELTDKILNIPCYYPWFYMIITADGSVAHCGEKEEKNDNIKDSGLEEIWYGKDFEKTREQFKKGNLPDYCNRCRPNVVGDARRIRKSIIEIRDKEYLINSLNEIKEYNHSLKTKKKIIRDGKGNFEKCGPNCRHKKELEEIKNNFLYKITSNLTSKQIGRSIKEVINKLMKNSPIEDSLGRKSKDELREKIRENLKENKRLKDEIYEIRNKKNIYEEVENYCKYKPILRKMKNSLTYNIIKKLGN
ncbi:MAG: radical SAM protein [Candidatus Aenigmatarchaeota archaeon]